MNMDEGKNTIVVNLNEMAIVKLLVFGLLGYYPYLPIYPPCLLYISCNSLLSNIMIF